MSKSSSANNDTDKSSYLYPRMGENHQDCPTQLRVRKERLGQVTTNKQEGKQSCCRTSSTSLTSCSHQRRWSTDCCHSNSSPVITVKKNTREPQPPQRGVSLRSHQIPSRHPRQRYSSPVTGIGSITHPSTSPTSSCSSVQTSVITGRDPLGWKLRTKSTTSSKRAHTKRLSLQTPIPVTVPDPGFLLSDTSPLDPKQNPTFKGKPFRRHHSDSLAFLKSMPAITLEELRHVQLRSAKPDDVFHEAYGKEMANPQPYKKPPAVPEKSPLARKIAQLISHSWQHQMCAARKSEHEEIIYSVIKPKAKTQETEKHCSLYAKINAMHLKSDD
ncbi:uncharacterized protein LOC119138312 [Syngnathus acus]|uniref:uncharacterized protein LOC119138312 n=1 Tax=Syngnathus acus TaxID=161584 RepID=UPI0018863C51|nr:uncharacterized protein LOC119138312 [Syngnathus acus]